jgi:hypothetical protein
MMKRLLLLLTLVMCCLAAAQNVPQEVPKEQLEHLVPQTYFFAGQTATTQLRNAGAIKFSDGRYLMLALVDVSGYSTGIAQKYQGLLITQVPLKVNDKTIPPGYYGFGSPTADHFGILDVNANEIAGGKIEPSTGTERPIPLRVTSSASTVTISLGRRSFSLQPAL